MKTNTHEATASLDITKTAVALTLLGLVATAATWITGYQGNLEKMLLDLIGGVVLGVGSAFLYQLVGPQERPAARLVVWSAAAYGAYVALSLATADMPHSQITKMVAGGALYGALLSGLVVTPLCSVVAWFRRAKAPSDA